MCVSADPFCVCAQPHEPVGIGKRQRPQQHGVDAEKTALFAPMPSASVSTTVTVKPGVRASARTE